MNKLLARYKHYLLTACFALLVGLTGCSSDDAATGSTNALPQPSVDCSGSSCVE